MISGAGHQRRDERASASTNEPLPYRFQLQRRAGWRMPAGGVSVARPHRWGNPYVIELYGRERAVALFDADLLAGRLSFTVADVRRELFGRHLGCFCTLDALCHGDVLLRVANG